PHVEAGDVLARWPHAEARSPPNVAARPMRPGARRLLNPRSIAIVGASQRSDAIGSRVLHNLKLMGYSGVIYPVNPCYESIDGLRCWPSLSSLPEAVDAAFLAVPASAGLALAEEAG